MKNRGFGSVSRRRRDLTFRLANSSIIDVPITKPKKYIDNNNYDYPIFKFRRRVCNECTIYIRGGAARLRTVCCCCCWPVKSKTVRRKDVRKNGYRESLCHCFRRVWGLWKCSRWVVSWNFSRGFHKKILMIFQIFWQSILLFFNYRQIEKTNETPKQINK